jgi:hypothetical protein
MRGGGAARVFVGAWLATLAASTASSAVTDVTVHRHGPWLEVDLRAPTMLDERVASTVESGLPGTCVYRCAVEQESDGVVARQVLELQIRLDLWENQYVLEGPGRHDVFSSLAAADSACSNVKNLVMMRLDDLLPRQRYRVRVESAVLPLGLEDRERISHFVSESGRGDHEFSLDVGAVLHRLFTGAGGGSGAPAAISTAFRPDELREREEKP